MIDINELRQSLGAVQPEEIAELLDRLEAAERERDALRTELEKEREEHSYTLHAAEAEAKQVDTLRAKIAERDELMAALQRIADGQEMSGVFTFADVVLRYQEIARTAIARATGEQT